MKKNALAALILAALGVAAVALAGPAVHTTLSVVGDTKWTNTDFRVPVQPVRFDAYGWTGLAGAADTITVSRIRSTRTNTLATLSFASGGGGTAWLNATNYLYLIRNDIVRVSAIGNGTGTIAIVSTQD